MTRERLAELREAEARASAKVVGVDQVEFLGYEDGLLEPTLEGSGEDRAAHPAGAAGGGGDHRSDDPVLRGPVHQPSGPSGGRGRRRWRR